MANKLPISTGKMKSRSLRSRFIRELTARKLTVAFAESVTCGLVMHQLAKVKGTTNVLKGGIVCYDETVKTKVLKVPHFQIEKHTAESKEVTKSLAYSLSRLIEADIHGAITGLAAPGGSETSRKPVGTIFIAVLIRNKCFNLRKVLKGTPTQIITKACDEMYRFILFLLRKSARKHED